MLQEEKKESNKQLTNSGPMIAKGDNIDNGEDDKEKTSAAKCCCFRRSTCRLALFMLFFVSYLCIGAACFMWLERPLEEEEKKKLVQTRADFLRDNPCVSEESLNHLLNVVEESNNRGVTIKNNVTSESNWAYGQSIFFAMTIVTTIGYGRTTPLSEVGKAYCIVYALFGIPLTMIMFTAMVERVYEPAINVLKWMEKKFLGKCTGFDLRMTHFFIAAVLLAVLLIFVPSGIFAYFETEWSYLDALYYCFISLTTVGLGDFIPGESTSFKYRDPYKIAVTIYLFVGLIGMLLFLRLFQNVPELNFGMQIYTSSDKITSSERKRLNSDAALAKSYTEESTVDEKSQTTK